MLDYHGQYSPEKSSRYSVTPASWNLRLKSRWTKQLRVKSLLWFSLWLLQTHAKLLGNLLVWFHKKWTKSWSKILESKWAFKVQQLSSLWKWGLRTISCRINNHSGMSCTCANVNKIKYGEMLFSGALNRACSLIATIHIRVSGYLEWQFCCCLVDESSTY